MAAEYIMEIITNCYFQCTTPFQEHYSIRSVMGNATIKPIPPRLPVSAGKTRICVGGFTLSHRTNRAATLARTIVSQYPDEYESWFYFDSKGFRDKDGLLTQVKALLTDEQKETFCAHKSSPLCWLETADGRIDCKGGGERQILRMGDKDISREWWNQKFSELPTITARGVGWRVSRLSTEIVMRKQAAKYTGRERGYF